MNRVQRRSWHAALGFQHCAPAEEGWSEPVFEALLALLEHPREDVRQDAADGLRPAPCAWLGPRLSLRDGPASLVLKLLEDPSLPNPEIALQHADLAVRDRAAARPDTKWELD